VPDLLGSVLARAASTVSAGVRAALASGESNLQQTTPLVWVMIAISAAGAIITFAFLTYALWKYRDPKVKHRRYG